MISKFIKKDKIPLNFFFYWSGQDFQYVYYLSILSLLKTNEVNKIEVYYEEEPTNNKNWEMLKNLDKIKFIKLDYDMLIKKCDLKREKFNYFFKKAEINHKSDFFRYLVLFCYGGIYLDFDTIIIKDLKPLLNTAFFVGHESEKAINGAVLGAKKESVILKHCFNEIIKNSKKSEKLHWSEVGPTLLTRILNQEIKFDFKIYPKSYFYFYHHSEWEEIFKKNLVPKETYLIHLWGKVSKEFTKRIDETYIRSDDSLYSNIVKKLILRELKGVLDGKL